MAVTYYYIRNVNSGMYLDNLGATNSGARIVQEPQGSQLTSQRWGLLYVGMGYYELLNWTNNMCLTVDAINPPNNTAVVQRPCSSQSGQSWLLSNVRGGGVFEWRVTQSGPCLDIASSAWYSGVSAVTFSCNGSASQGWVLYAA
jgi:hypothetical protein